MVSASANSVAQRFRYNGIELEESLGIDWYKMDMRQYDPAIARWTSIDPVVHHEYSTYSAFDSNPVFWADPSGADSQVHWEGNLETTTYEERMKSKKENVGKAKSGNNPNPYKAYFAQESKKVSAILNDMALVDAATTALEAKDSFDAGIMSFVEDTYTLAESWLQNPLGTLATIVSGTVDEIESTTNDFISSGYSDPGLFMLDRSYTAMSNMTLNDWAYAAGYSAPGAASGIFGGYVMSGVRVSSLIYTSWNRIPDISGYTTTRTVANNLASRPFINSPHTIRNIISTGRGVPDEFFKGGRNWVTPGTFNGSEGIFELGMNTSTKVIYHFMFRSN
ncbi:RHS repeat-associated core domain-containing protein [Winogradskyella sp.]|uniref:RHS repeat-associated core domain-containing protein n=1 Tax=Winogradskyella sp. TaxID=1883156 RepID=UPI00261B1CAF|nr:RHS repeat-associated core domain-containing protein [Winogradskyella sp.]